MRPPRRLLLPRGLPLWGLSGWGLPPRALVLGGLVLGGPVVAGPVLTLLAGPFVSQPAAAATPAVAPPASAAPTPAPPSPPLNPGWAFDPTGPFQPGPAEAPLLLPGEAGHFNPSAPRPLAISGPRPLVPPCPLIVPPRDYALQPLHLPPQAVPLKNRFGCLSAADAIYGPDGCPKRLCGKAAESPIRLPPGGP